MRNYWILGCPLFSQTQILQKHMFAFRWCIPITCEFVGYSYSCLPPPRCVAVLFCHLLLLMFDVLEQYVAY